ncbi:MAG: hypothetical protein JRF31_05870 [Deltaproteobacteria bacterium]|nr:hypothetical protein [Deltaproteobacteria bacterium]
MDTIENLFAFAISIHYKEKERRMIAGTETTAGHNDNPFSRLQGAVIL